MSPTTGYSEKHRFQPPQHASGRGQFVAVGRGLSLYWDLQPPNTWPRHQHPTAQIVIAPDAGRYELRWQARRHARRVRVSTPHVWLVPPQTPHSARWADPGAILKIYLEPDFIRDECGADLTEVTVLALSPLLQRDYLVASFCRRVQDHCHNRRHMSEAMIFAAATLLAAAFLRTARGRSEGPPLRRLSERQIEAIAEFLEHQVMMPITPADLAEVAGLSEDYFCRLFRRTVNEPPMKYVWHFRVHRAMALLQTGEHKVAQVALETGFHDQSHLHRHFKRVFRCSPGSVIPKAPPRPPAAD